MENTAASTPTAAAHAPEDADVVRVLRDDRDDNRDGASLDPATDPRVPVALVVKLYREMTRVRALDERLVALQRQGRIGFHVGSYGEEAAILGSAAAMRDADWLFPAYREFGAALWRGMSLEAYLNHMFGNAGDPVKGRQMPDHYSARGARFASVSSPVGTQITHAAGFAWAAKIKRDDVVTLVYFGEGATSSGEFHNGVNFAGVFKVPLVLFCRNNSWSQTSSSAAAGVGAAASTSAGTQAGGESFAEKGIAYGVPFARCDGNDLFAVLKVVRDAVARASASGGPTLIEALTSRLASGEHGVGDASWKRRDPLARVRRYLEGNGLWNDTLQRALEASLEAELGAAIDAAEKVAPPALETLFDDVYAVRPRHLDEQRAELLAAPRPPPRKA